MEQAGAAALDFNCVPHWVVEDLRDVGNWKVRPAWRARVHCWACRAGACAARPTLPARAAQARAAAVEALHSAVLEVQDKLVLLPTLSKLLQFLMSLVADPNFKAGWKLAPDCAVLYSCHAAH